MYSILFDCIHHWHRHTEKTSSQKFEYLNWSLENPVDMRIHICFNRHSIIEFPHVPASDGMRRASFEDVEDCEVAIQPVGWDWGAGKRQREAYIDGSVQTYEINITYIEQMCVDFTEVVLRCFFI